MFAKAPPCGPTRTDALANAARFARQSPVGYYDEGILTEAEFQAKKAELLAAKP